MQAVLNINTDPMSIDEAEWRRIAYRECVYFSEHGVLTEEVDGHTVCFNCGGRL